MGISLTQTAVQGSPGLPHGVTVWRGGGVTLVVTVAPGPLSQFWYASGFHSVRRPLHLSVLINQCPLHGLLKTGCDNSPVSPQRLTHGLYPTSIFITM